MGIICVNVCLAVCTQSDVDSQPQAVAKPGPDAGSRPQLTTAAEESKSHVDMGGPDSPEESSSSKKVVKVVRRVVRRVIPAGTEQPNQPAVSEAAKAASAADSALKTTRAGGEDRDDISMGLTSLMGRSRTKEHRPRTRTQDRKEDVKEEVKQEEEKEKVEEEEERPTVVKTEEAAPTPAPAPDPAPPKSNPLSPPAGFLPAPKPDPLAPPAGFIPVPKQNLLIPPPGFIPARKSSPVPPKQNPLARPPGFVPVIKTDLLAPPARFIPKPHPVAKKTEVLSEKVHVCYLTSGWSLSCGNNTDITVHVHASPHNVYPERHLQLEQICFWIMTTVTSLKSGIIISPEVQAELSISDKNQPRYNEATPNK